RIVPRVSYSSDDAAIVRSVDDQLACGLEPGAADISLKLIHQISASPDHTRPAEVVANLVDDIIGDHIKEVLAFDEILQCLADELEIWLGACISRIFVVRHSLPLCAVAAANSIERRRIIHLRRIQERPTIYPQKPRASPTGGAPATRQLR